jgi:hypothetical protein
LTDYLYRAMKTLFAILFSLLLIVSQAMSVGEVREVGVQKAARCCGHCGSCQQRSCCARNNDSGPRQSAPAAPSRGVSPNDLQFWATVSVELLPPVATEPVVYPASFSDHLSFAAPLYERNCSYLI